MDSINSLEIASLDIIQGGKSSTDDDFQAAAWATFLYQFSKNKPYANYCSALGGSPDRISKWHEIPAVPTDAFKLTSSPLITFPEDQITHTFLTSGTTRDVRGAHHFPSTRIYEASILHGWSSLTLPHVNHAIFLTPTPDAAPESSLSHMMGTLAPQISPSQHWVLDQQGDIDTDAITRASAEGKPVAILGTALSFLHLFESEATLPHLPAGSWAFETGGYKGTDRAMEKADLYSLFKQHLGLAAGSVINEYSMTELSSQFYTRGLGRPHTAPPWTRIRVIDPTTGKDCPPGTPGYLCIYDLANLHSVMAIQTQDIAMAKDNRTFTLIGRDPSALPRGCSRSADVLHSTAS